MKKEEVLIYGAGGHGKVVLEILLSNNKVKVLGFLDDQPKKTGLKIRGYKILGGWSYLKDNKGAKVVLGIGNNEIRKAIFEKMKKIGVKVETAIHAKSILSKDTKIGEGVVIMPGAIINPGVIIEEGVVVNTGATVDHDCRLRSFCQIWPGAHLAGSVEVGALSYIGTGAAVTQNIKIGKNVTIGAGAAVISNISDNVVAVGVPAKEIGKK
jgi:sugar O-acyltransferase (sialic acid O-acetyltransferase NeuD family)